MPSIQVGVRIPPHLHEKLSTHAAQAEASKSEVIITALTHYLGCTGDTSLSQKLIEIEERVTALETLFNKNY